MKALLELIRGIDFYGKVPVFYFKGKIKKYLPLEEYLHY